VRVLLKLIQLLLIAVAVLGIIVLFYIAVNAFFDQPQLFLVMLIPLFVGALMLFIVWTMLATAARRRRASVVLNYIEQAVRLNLPLPRVVQALAESEGGRFARDLEEAKIRLEQGESLATVLEVIPKIPPRIIGLVAAAERTGRLPQVMSRMMEQRRNAVSRGLGYMPFYRMYPLVLAITLISVASMLVIFVMPKFEQIFRDFHTDLPLITQWVFYFPRIALPWMALLLIVLFLALLLNAVITRWQGAGYGVVPGPAARVADLLPIVGRIRMIRAMGEAMTFAADAVEAGRPLDTSLLEAAQLSSNFQLRRRIGRWVDLLVRGESPSQAARNAHLPRLVWGMFAAAIQTPDLAPVLRFLGRYYATRFSRSIALLEASVAPIMAITMGVFVGLLALSIFAPMIALIQAVSAPALKR
jgi:type II secretory pathway component PulF